MFDDLKPATVTNMHFSHHCIKKKKKDSEQIKLIGEVQCILVTAITFYFGWIQKMSSAAFNRAVTRVQWPKKERIHRQMLELQPFSLLPHRLTPLNTLAHMRAQSQMGKGKAVALPT